MIGLCTLGCFTTILRAGCDLDTARTGALATPYILSAYTCI